MPYNYLCGKKLSPDQYNVCFRKGTEPPFSGKYYNHHEQGKYVCAVCRRDLFSSTTKFDSGTGWPSFFDAMDPNAVKRVTDTTHGKSTLPVLKADETKTVFLV